VSLHPCSPTPRFASRFRLAWAELTAFPCPRYGLDAKSIRIDLTEERPQWILSCYSPTRDNPRQLFGGLPREQSPEEMRVRHYELAAQGLIGQAQAEAQQLYQEAEAQIKAALDDLPGSIKYIIDGEKEHPNRLDICAGAGSQRQPNPPSTV
jgi:nucleoporin NUP42